MRTISRSFVCAKHRTEPSPDPIAVWARDVVARPEANYATPREAQIVADLLTSMQAGR